MLFLKMLTLKMLCLKRIKMINLQTFVKLQEVDSIYFDTPYYLEPQKSGEKAYQLLMQALEKSKTAGLGTFVMRSGRKSCNHQTI
ncbi:Ku protein [Sphingobacterium daejeonense]|nr:Ku protein [Sphingobacterium daejeonense]